jgi:hypothetical protein
MGIKRTYKAGVGRTNVCEQFLFGTSCRPGMSLDHARLIGYTFIALLPSCLWCALGCLDILFDYTTYALELAAHIGAQPVLFDTLRKLNLALSVHKPFGNEIILDGGSACAKLGKSTRAVHVVD